VSEKKKCTCGKSQSQPYCDGSHKVRKLREEISDADFDVFMNAFLGDYKGGAYNPE
jgi:hypothetical protein